MITAGIDVGTNSVRMIIAEVQNGKIIKKIDEGRGITRLGAGIDRTGRLSDASMQKTLDLFEEFSTKLKKHNVQHMFAAATSAVRETSNSEEFLKNAQQRGINLKTISGEEEARYTYLGVISELENIPEEIIIYDIGGGSTELTYVKKGSVIYSESIPVGVVKLADKFSFADTVDKATQIECVNYLTPIFGAVIDKITALGADKPVLIGTAGSVTSISAIELGLKQYDPAKVNRHIITLDNMTKICNMLSSMTAQERLSIGDVVKGREDLLIPGCYIIEVIMKKIEVYKTSVSDNGLREGLAIAASI